MSTAGRGRAPRSVRASLALIVLSVEFLVVILATLVLFGVGSLPTAVALGGGAVLLVLIVAAAALARRPVGLVLGWIAQGGLLLGGLANVAVLIVAVLFVALWTYSIIVGGRIDRRAA